jgi:hypothetical protein
MIIQLESTSARNAEAARHSLEALARSWGQEITQAPAGPARAAGVGRRDEGKAVDPVALATLVLSIPPAALAVLDLADRIRKRRRAQELIDQARQLAAQQVTICLLSPRRTVDLRTLTPDQLLDQLADEDPAS